MGRLEASDVKSERTAVAKLGPGVIKWKHFSCQTKFRLKSVERFLP